MADWHEAYRQRYQQLKQQGKSFFPYAIFKDTLVAFLLFGALCALAYFVGAEVEDLADPTDTTYNPRPEWYFLFLFEALKFFPGHLEAVAAVVLPGVSVLLLCAVPFLDRGPRRHPFDRPFFTLLGIGALLGVLYLTYRSAMSPLTNPIVEKDPLVLAGQRFYRELKCAYCHSLDGIGGRIGPDLLKIAGRRDKAWLTRHFRDPRSLSPNSPMPRLELLEDEIEALVAYIISLGGAGPYTPEAPKLFAANCAACHRLGKQGAEVGPDLSLIGTARDKAFIKRYTQDPTQLNPSATMPGFKDRLTDVQIEDLARYLASQRGG